MATKTKTVKTKTVRDKELIHKTISNLTDVVASLEHDVKKIKIRLGI